MKKGDFVYIVKKEETIKAPETHLFIPINNSIYWAAGIISGGTLFKPTIVLPNDPTQTQIKPTEYHLLPQPDDTIWINWKEEEPPANRFVYTRDIDGINDWEVAWTIGDTLIEVVLPDDPTMNRYKMDQWQLIPPPIKN